MKNMKSAKDSYEDFINFCKLRDENGVLLLLEEGAFVDDSDENGITPLHVASAVGAENIIRLLMLKGPDIDKNTSLGWTPLMYAARNGHSKCSLLLIAFGANIHHKNKFGVNVLSMAIASGNEELMKILLQAGQRESLSDSIISPLHITALQGQSTILQSLLGSQIHLINKCDKHGITPLMLAVAGGHEEVIKILLDFGADTNLQNSHQFTALDIASTKRYRKILHLLKDKTEKGDELYRNSFQFLEIGSDLIEQYGWSSVCTPKPRRSTLHNDSLKENILNSPTHQRAGNSNIPSQVMEDRSSLFTPIHLPLNEFSVVSVNTSLSNNLRTDTNATCVPVPPVSPYNCSISPFNFPKTNSPKKQHSLGRLNCNCTHQVQPELDYSLIKEHNCKNNSPMPVTYPSQVQKNFNKILSKLKEESNGRLQRIRKLEKWFHTVFTSWQKKSNTKNNTPHCQEKTLSPQENAQHHFNTHEREIPSSFQNDGRWASINDNCFSPTSTLKNFLMNHKLETYIPLFMEHEVDMDSFLMLREEDLEEMGISSPKSKSKFLKVIMTFQGDS